MAELTSGLTCVVFPPYSKMFIGGLSWQTSPGESDFPSDTLVLVFRVVFVLFVDCVSAAVVAAVACECVRARVYTVGYVSAGVRATLFPIFVHLKSSIRPLCASRRCCWWRSGGRGLCVCARARVGVRVYVCVYFFFK